MTFKNPANGYIEEASHPWLWTLLFGVFYFVYKGVWRHVFIWILLFPLMSWFIYPFFASDIVRKNYLRNGWIEVDKYGQSLKRSTGNIRKTLYE